MSDNGPSPAEVIRGVAPLLPVVGTLVTLANVADELTDLANYVNVLTDFASDPFGFVFEIISTYIVGTILGLGRYLIRSVLTAFGFVTAPLQAFGALLVSSLYTVLAPVTALVQQLTAIIATTVMAAGPLGPPIAAMFAAALAYGLYRIIIAVAGEVPVGSTVVDLLRLR